MVAGTLAPPVDANLELVNTQDLEGRELAFALVISKDGELRYRGKTVDGAVPYLSDLRDGSIARVMPDREASALRLLEVSRELSASGIERVMIVTEKVAK